VCLVVCLLRLYKRALINVFQMFIGSTRNGNGLTIILVIVACIVCLLITICATVALYCYVMVISKRQSPAGGQLSFHSFNSLLLLIRWLHSFVVVLSSAQIVHRFQLHFLTPWRPLLPYGLPYARGWASECPDVNNYNWRLTRSGTRCFIGLLYPYGNNGRQRVNVN